MTAPYADDEYQDDEPRGNPPINVGRLWAGGLATMAVAALAAFVGLLVIRGIFNLDVLTPLGGTVIADDDALAYLLGAAGVALLATGMMHLLLLFAPRPIQFFSWIIGLFITAAVLTPFTTDASFSAQLATASINLLIGLSIASLLGGVAHSATRPRVQIA